MKKLGASDWTKEDEMELRFLESLFRRCSQNIHLIRALADLYTRAGRYQRGLELDLLLAELCDQDSEVWYNLACSYTLTGEYDGAFQSLYKALDLGYDNVEWLVQDEDLQALREDPRYTMLVKKLEPQMNANGRKLK